MSVMIMGGLAGVINDMKLDIAHRSDPRRPAAHISTDFFEAKRFSENKSQF